MDSDLKITIEKPATWSRRLTITVPADRLERERATAAKQLASKVRLPGFRKGKVPAHVIERRFGAALEQEMLERVVNETFREAITQEGLQPITQASINELDYKPGSDLTFHAEFEIRPEVELNQLGGFAVQKQVPAVEAEAVDRVIDRLREQQASWGPVENEAPLVGDMAVVEITPLEGENAGQSRRYQVYMGEGQVRPEIEEVIRTVKVGETGEFSVDLPADAENPDSPLEAHRIKVHVAELQRATLPVVDDAFAQAAGPFENLDALRSRISEDLHNEAEQQAAQDVRRQLMDQIIQANPFDVPETMVSRYLDQVIRPRKDDDPEKIREIRETSRPMAENALRRMLVIERVAELEGLHPTADEIDERYQEMAGRYNRSTQEIRAQLKKEGREHEVEEALTEEKVYQYLESLSTIE
jgi:trigger factor